MSYSFFWLLFKAVGSCFLLTRLSDYVGHGELRKLFLRFYYSQTFPKLLFTFRLPNFQNNILQKNKQKALALKAEIDRTDKEIDQMVYELYGQRRRRSAAASVFQPSPHSLGNPWMALPVENGGSAPEGLLGLLPAAQTPTNAARLPRAGQHGGQNNCGQVDGLARKTLVCLQAPLASASGQTINWADQRPPELRPPAKRADH